MSRTSYKKNNCLQMIQQMSKIRKSKLKISKNSKTKEKFPVYKAISKILAIMKMKFNMILTSMKRIKRLRTNTMWKNKKISKK